MRKKFHANNNRAKSKKRQEVRKEENCGEKVAAKFPLKIVRKRCGSILDEEQLPALIVGRLFTPSHLLLLASDGWNSLILATAGR